MSMHQYFWFPIDMRPRGAHIGDPAEAWSLNDVAVLVGTSRLAVSSITVTIRVKSNSQMRPVEL